MIATNTTEMANKKVTTTSQLAERYGITTETLRRWLRREHLPCPMDHHRRTFTPAETELIYKVLG